MRSRRRLASGGHRQRNYFDVIQFDETSVALCVGDVMGKGMRRPW
jgi:hypothetical protein